MHSAVSVYVCVRDLPLGVCARRIPICVFLLYAHVSLCVQRVYGR